MQYFFFIKQTVGESNGKLLYPAKQNTMKIKLAKAKTKKKNKGFKIKYKKRRKEQKNTEERFIPTEKFLNETY